MALRKIGSIVGIACLLALAFLVVPATPAGACSCIGPMSPDDYLNQADAAFLGDVIAARIADPESLTQGDVRVGSASMVFTFDVREVYKGSVRERQEVVSNMDGAACGAGFELNRRYLVYARGPANGSQLATSLCEGSGEFQATGSPPVPGHGESDTADPPSGELVHAPAPGVSPAVFGGLLLLSGAIAGAAIAVAGRT